MVLLAAVQQHRLLRAIEQVQALVLTPVISGGVELEGKSASIKSISDSIQSSDRRKPAPQPQQRHTAQRNP